MDQPQNQDKKNDNLDENGAGLNEPAPQPEQPANQNQPEPEGWPWSRRTSYPPHTRKLKGKTDRIMKHPPILKLDPDLGNVTEVETWPVQLPFSLPGIYPMKSKVYGHGVALIINNENFAHNDKRNGRKKI